MKLATLVTMKNNIKYNWEFRVYLRVLNTGKYFKITLLDQDLNLLPKWSLLDEQQWD